jgi:hypothetical protein
MTLQYSRFFFPNTPVDVCTLVGKYEYLLDTKWYKPTAGQTLRVVNAKTHYLNVLRTCVGYSPRTQIQRQLVHLEADALAPSSHTPQVVDLSPKSCSLQTYVKACYLTSNTICFVDDSIERLANNYIAWIQACVRVAEEPVQPTACIVVCGSLLDHSPETLACEFKRKCASTEDRASAYALGSCCFSHTEVLYHEKLSNHRRHSRIDWQLLDTVEQRALGTSSNHLHSLGYYWTEHSVHHLCSRSLAFFAKHTDTRQFSIALALSVDLVKGCPTLPHQIAFFCPTQPFVGQGDVAGALVPLLGKYMAYHLLAHCPLLDIENFKVSPASDRSLFDCLFRQRYEPVANQILARVETSQQVTTSLPHTVKAHVLASIAEYLSAADCITLTHLSSLGKYGTFFQQQQHPQRLCAGCFFAYWDDVLPCRHGFCKVCTHNLSLQWKHSARIQITHCPVCLVIFPKPFRIRVQPPTAGGRVLSLDGGGVKGIIELEILQQLRTLIGGELPMDALFDLVVGTSIGKSIFVQVE